MRCIRRGTEHLIIKSIVDQYHAHYNRSFQPVKGWYKCRFKSFKTIHHKSAVIDNLLSLSPLSRSLHCFIIKLTLFFNGSPRIGSTTLDSD
jgi:hypothetical protein